MALTTTTKMMRRTGKSWRWLFKRRKERKKKECPHTRVFLPPASRVEICQEHWDHCPSRLHIFSVKRNFAQFNCTFHKLIFHRKHWHTFVANQETSQITRFYKTLGLQNYDGGNFVINFMSASVVSKNIPHLVHFPASAHCTLHTAHYTLSF